MTLTTGRLAKRTGIGIQTIRFYEREGLIEPAPRTSAGYRSYDEHAVARLNFIRRAQGLGFTLKEIRELIALETDRDAPCEKVCDAASGKVAAIETKIAELNRMKESLQTLIAACSGNTTLRDCAVIECLTS